MPQYYFHIRSDAFGDTDKRGQELENIEAAQEEAFKIIAQLLESWPTGWPKAHSNTRVEVADHANRAVLLIPFLARAGAAEDQAAWWETESHPDLGNATLKTPNAWAARVVMAGNKKAL